MKSFDNKVVVITGAASGIGEALAHAFAARGAKLLLADIDEARLLPLAQRLREGGTVVVAQRCDVAQAVQVRSLAERGMATLGPADIVINNAGVALVAPVVSARLEDAQWLIGINFWGVVHGCRAFDAQLRSRPEAVIVNLSSIFAMVSMPTQAYYHAAKAAVRAFSDSLREELRATTVRVLCVHPGGIRTRIAESARLGDISSVAASPAELHEAFARNAHTSAADAAAAILRALERGKTRLLIGADAKVLDLWFRVAPARASAWFTLLLRWERKRRQKAKAASAAATRGSDRR